VIKVLPHPLLGEAYKAQLKENTIETCHKRFFLLRDNNKLMEESVLSYLLLC
jgi:hypothetical protein